MFVPIHARQAERTLDRMTTLTLVPAPTLAGGRQAALARLVGAIGSDAFGPALAGYLHGLCGADHCAAFHLQGDALTELAASCVQPERTARELVDRYVGQGWWRHDPAMGAAQRCLAAATPTVIHVDFADRGYVDLRPRVYPDVSDRLLLCGRAAGHAFGLSVLRQQPHGAFPGGAIETLADSAELLVALLGRHAQRGRPAPDAAFALRARDAIETCIAASGCLPRREAEVCARILHGLSSAGIALDLQVSEETVKTYRKRAYRRLEIGSERELLNWYLARWSRLHQA